jgi:hypothetical protein
MTAQLPDPVFRLLNAYGPPHAHESVPEEFKKVFEAANEYAKNNPAYSVVFYGLPSQDQMTLVLVVLKNGTKGGLLFAWREELDGDVITPHAVNPSTIGLTTPEVAELAIRTAFEKDGAAFGARQEAKLLTGQIAEKNGLIQALVNAMGQTALFNTILLTIAVVLFTFIIALAEALDQANQAWVYLTFLVGAAFAAAAWRLASRYHAARLKDLPKA